jgi:creatinine amidohydrolase
MGEALLDPDRAIKSRCHNHHHPNNLGFPGTISLTNETFTSILVETISSLKPHGFYRFLIVNGHGGNIGNLTATVSKIGEELGISIPALSYWQTIIRPVGINYVN